MLLKRYPRDTAIIRFRLDGEIVTWPIGALAGADSEASLRRHLAKWYPDAEFLECAIK
jgi:hypothetical protein